MACRRAHGGRSGRRARRRRSVIVVHDVGGHRISASLTPEQKAKAVFPFASDERLHWHFIPTGPPPMFPRNGLTIKEMSEAQRKAAHALLKASLSQRGYMTASSIMDLETVLGALEAAQRAAARSLRAPRRSSGTRSATSSRCSAHRRPRRRGDGASKAITCRCTSPW
jgi:Protein of unknown function (DUF3500).